LSFRELAAGVSQYQIKQKSRSGAESLKNAVSGYGLPRYHGRVFVRTPQSDRYF